MDTKKILKDVERLHDKAVDGAAIINKVRYTLHFDRYQGIYTAKDPNGNEIGPGFNTRKATVARKYLKEYLED